MYKFEGYKADPTADPIFGQLTHNGIFQMRHVGEQLVGVQVWIDLQKKIYMDEEQFITPENYNNADILVRSTCRDRTLHSVQSLLSGFFPISYFFYSPTKK